MDKLAFVLWSVLWPLACEYSAYLGVRKRQIKNEPQRTEEEEKSGNGVLLAIWVIVAILLWNSSKASNPPIKCIPGLRDTHLHFLANSHGVPAIGITMYQKGYTQVQSIVSPVIVMSAVSLGKEISDKQRGGRISGDDLIADFTGIITGAFITLVVNGLIQHFRENREVERAYRNYKPVKF